MLNLAHYEDIEHQLMSIFREIIFQPISDVIRKNHPGMEENKMLNSAKEDLAEAMRTGDVQYHDGIFSGTFRAKTSKALREIGATFDQRSRTYKMPISKVPPEVKANAANYSMKAKTTNESIIRKLNEVQTNIDTILDRSRVKSHRLVDRVVSDFHDVARKIEIPVNMSEKIKSNMAEKYSDNMDLWIKKFVEEEIHELREKVEDNAIEGYRFDNLVSVIKNRYSVSQNKAKFLARQETALFVSKFRKERFTEAGVKRYRWSTSHDERVRPAPWVKGKARLDNHRILDGKIFYYDDPPVVDMATGRRANPGEDFNCRCVDIPILDPVHSTASTT